MKLNEMRKQIREQIAAHLEYDLNGGELIMKEIWEDKRIPEEVVKKELEDIIIWLRDV